MNQGFASMEKDSSVESVRCSAANSSSRSFQNNDASTKNTTGRHQHVLSVGGSAKWSVTFAAAAVPKDDEPRVSQNPTVLDSIAVSCDECRIKIWIKELSIGPLHGVDTWDTLLIGSSDESVKHCSLVASDEKEALALKLLLSMASRLATSERNDISWDSPTLLMVLKLNWKPAS
jgi:hypothetical protein